jgi:hypothetical protein
LIEAISPLLFITDKKRFIVGENYFYHAKVFKEASI